MSDIQQNAAPGWYNDGSGAMRWWDGAQWTSHAAAPPQMVVAVNRKEVGIGYLLAILLGGLGIHHFYYGNVGAGIGMLSLALVGSATAAFVVGIFLLFAVFVWWVVDLCMMRSYAEAANQKLFAQHQQYAHHQQF